jgi:large subunit ribosomal protein L2
MKQFNPVNNSMRNLILTDRSLLAKKPASVAKSSGLITGKSRISARNNNGHITVRYRGGGHKKLARLVDFKSYNLLASKDDRIISEVVSIEYDPNRSAFLALLKSHTTAEPNKIYYRYVIASSGMKIGSAFICTRNPLISDMIEGSTFPLSQIRIGTKVFNIELKHGSGGVIARSAGAYAELIGVDGEHVMLRLISGETRLVPSDCFATIGVVSNLDHKNQSFSKAGRKRWMGIKPHVRGVAMNPVDHPHGGGEGKTSGGRHPVTPWGKPTKGKKTRHKRKLSDKLILGKKK